MAETVMVETTETRPVVEQPMEILPIVEGPVETRPVTEPEEEILPIVERLMEMRHIAERVMGILPVMERALETEYLPVREMALRCDMENQICGRRGRPHGRAEITRGAGQMYTDQHMGASHKKDLTPLSGWGWQETEITPEEAAGDRQKAEKTSNKEKSHVQDQE